MLTLNGVLNSKVYINEKSAVTYGSPKTYIEPFLEKLSSLNQVTYRVEVSDRVANKDADSSLVNEAFGRVLVEAKLPQEYSIHDHDQVIGIMYALDVQKPIIKVYTGHNAWACTNLAIFGASCVHTVDLLQGTQAVYDRALEYVSEVAKKAERFQRIFKDMNDKIYEGQEVDRVLGYLLREGNRNKQIGTTPVLFAVKELETASSRYALRDNGTSQWNLFSAMTQYITDKTDIMDKATKTVLISNLFVNSFSN